MKFLRDWYLTIIVVLAILWLTLPPQPLPDEADIQLFAHADKVVHAIMFGGLTAMAFVDLRRQHKVLTKKLILIVGLCTALFACLDEWSQQFTGRTTDIFDAIADLVGIALVITTLLLSKYQK